MTGLSTELQAELVEFVRFAADPDSMDTEIFELAGSLVAKLPTPVDPDIEEARKLLRQAGGWFAPSMDSNPAWQQTCTGPGLTLAAIKLGRELERSGK